LIRLCADDNRGLFIRGTALLCFRAVFGTVVDVFGSFTQRTLALQLSSQLAHSLQDKALSGSMYYKLKNVDGRIDDLDTRLVDDTNEFSETLSGMWDRLVPAPYGFGFESSRFERSIRAVSAFK
jgi:ABC-type uncharacterized transport system fused permease/ATPase subunit